jgi:hypothetical protein
MSLSGKRFIKLAKTLKTAADLPLYKKQENVA